MNEWLYSFLVWINIRHRILDSQWLWFELYDIFDSTLKVRKEKYWDIIWDLYYDRVNKRMVSNIYDSNEWLYNINKNFESIFQVFPVSQQKNIYNQMKIDSKIIIAQTNSLILRPKDIIEPIEYQSNLVKDIEITSDWFVRVMHYEKQLFTKDKYNESYKEYSVYWSVFFWKEVDIDIEIKKLMDLHNSLDIKSIYDRDLWIFPHYEELLPISYIEKFDMLENYKILWLSNYLLDKLDLEIWPYYRGLYATNSQWEIIVKYNQWYSNYMWLELNKEIPKLDGAELLIRKDYFDKIVKFHKVEPSYFINIL